MAHSLGYHDRSPSKRIEKFMRDLYTHMRNVFLITRTLEQRMALLPRGAGPAFAARLAAQTAPRTGNRGRLSVYERRNPRRVQPHFPRISPAG